LHGFSNEKENIMNDVKTVSVPEFDAAVSAAIARTVEPRSLSAIARDIRRTWPKIYFAAVPYLQAMAQLDGIDSDYGQDSAKSIVLYFLSNATTWRGEDARRLKAELKKLAGIK
jgi:hypothetical protein